MRWTTRGAAWGALNLFFFAAIAVLGSVFLYSSLTQKNQSQPDAIGRVVDQSGSVQIRSGRNRGWQSAAPEAPIYDKTSVYTENASTASLQVRETLVQVDEKTLIQVIDPQKRTELFMDFGGLQLSSKKDEQIILNVGGEKLKLSLRSATVKIRKEKKSGALKITSQGGPVRIESDRQSTVEIEPNHEVTINTVAAPSPEIEPPVAAKPELKLHFDSVYVDDSAFSRRPALKLSVLSEVKNAKFEISADGQSWRALPGTEFVPESEGDYEVRATGVFADGSEAMTQLGPWSPKREHFLQRQPAFGHSIFKVDPTQKDARPLWTERRPSAAEFSFANGKSKELQISSSFGLRDVPAGTVTVRALSSDVSYAFEKRELALELFIPKPEPRVEKNLIRLKPIVLPQYEYEAFVDEERRSLALNQGTHIDPACEMDCTVRIRYRSRLNPDWISREAVLKIHGQPKVLRQVAALPEAEPTSTSKIPLRRDRIRVKEPWLFEAGIGGNYMNMNTSSSLVSASTSGFSGPTVYLAAERQYEKFNWKGSLMDVHTKMSTTSGGTASQQNLDWLSLWTGISTPGIWLFPRLEYGVSYQDTPLLYQNAAGSGLFANAHTLAATIGFNSSFEIGERGLLLWDQRLLLPVSSGASSEIQSFKPKFGIDGALTYYHCLENQWAVGASWLGQYSEVDFQLANGNGLLADSPSARMLNSNFQLRAHYGLCSFLKR